MSLEDIKARAEAATEGPWELAGGNEWLSPLGIDVGHEDESSHPTLLAKDAVFIAYARTDIPKLVATLEAIGSLVEQERPAEADESHSPAVAQFDLGYRHAMREVRYSIEDNLKDVTA